jgi:hypothetical protein
MCGIVHEASLHRVLMDVVQLLPHHFVILYLLGFRPFLPDLVLAFSLVLQLVKAELLEQRDGAALLK